MQVLTIEAKNENLQKVIDFVDAVLVEHDCSLKVQTQIELCVEEIFVNIANYAYGDEIGNAEVSVEENDGAVTITFKDGGIPYNPLAKDDPDTTLKAEEREIGGLGIFLVKKNMDSVSYEYKDSQNIFSMKKSII
ncbi:MAG: ATP-binding protein [Eubacterium sp.]|nr:ATP-binding protein [Eubacterium sp.]